MIKFLSSLKFGVILLIIIIPLLIVSTFNPLILNSLLFMIPSIMFTLNLLLCTIKRVRRRLSIGPDIIHIGLLSLIISGYISFFGSISTVKILKRGDSLNYREYKITIEEFYLETYDDGHPKDWKTLLKITRKNSLLKSSTIEVGQPLRFKGIQIYQYSFSKEGTGLLFKVDRGYYLKLISLIVIFSGLVITYYKKLKEFK